MAVDVPALKKVIVSLVGLCIGLGIVWVLIAKKPDLFPARFRQIFPWAVGIGFIFVLAVAALTYFARKPPG